MKPMISRRSVAIAALSTALFAQWSQATTVTQIRAYDYEAASGRLVKEIIEPTDSAKCLVTVYTLDTFGNRKVRTLRNCNGSVGSVPAANNEAAAPTGDPVFTTRAQTDNYDTRGQFVTSSVNALTQTENKTYDARFGALASRTDPNSIATTWTYDGYGRKTLETRPDGTKTKWDYLYCTGVNGGTTTCPTIGGAVGAWLIVETPLASNGTTQNGPLIKTYFDTLNRVIRTETQGFDGSGTSTAIYKDTQYDSLGRVYKTSRPYYTGQTAYWDTYTYDILNRQTKLTRADTTTVTNAYSGLVTTITNSLSQVQVVTKNSQGKTISVKDPNLKTLTYSYTPTGQLAKTTDSLGNVVQFTYDIRDRKISLVDPDLGTWTYAYDALGQLIRQVDAKTQTTTQTYDLLGRLTQRGEADLVSTWYYDTYKGGGICTKGIGKLCQSETSTGYSRTVTYDSVGRIGGSSTLIDTTYAESVTYDTNGRMATHTWPSGLGVTYTYTTLGYLQKITNTASTALYWQANTLDAEQHLLLQTYGNSIQTSQAYSPTTGRVSALTAGAGNAIQNFGYGYDNNGNLTSRSDSNDAFTESFTYDVLNRLKTATVNATAVGVQTTSFAYDDLGNVTTKSDLGTYTYPTSGATSVRPHAVSQVTLSAGGRLSFAYDANGNLTGQTQYDAANAVVTAQSRTYTPASFNLPQSMTRGSVSSTFAYGPDHQRVKQISSDIGTTIYLNPGINTDLFYETDTRPDNTVEQRHFIAPTGMPVVLVKYVTPAGGSTTITTRYLHRDHLGSVTTVTDETGALVERLAYEPFGKRRYPTGVTDPNGLIRSLTTTRGFTNQEELDALGLIHMNGRIYDPVVGRFTSADPTVPEPEDPQSYNRFSYVRNNPLNFTDPTGFSDVPNDGAAERGTPAISSNGGQAATKGAAGLKPDGSAYEDSVKPGSAGALQRETWATIRNGTAMGIANIPSDTANGVAGWVEQFMHVSPGTYGRWNQIVQPRNDVAQEVAGDVRGVVAVAAMMTPLRVTRGLAGNGSAGSAAKSAANGTRLGAQLAFEEAGILTRGGAGLTKEAIALSREIPISGGRLTNPAVVKELTANGSRIEDWGKFTTQSIKLPSGQSSQIHFYQNRVTGEANLNVDFKIKGIVQ